MKKKNGSSSLILSITRFPLREQKPYKSIFRAATPAERRCWQARRFIARNSRYIYALAFLLCFLSLSPSLSVSPFSLSCTASIIQSQTICRGCVYMPFIRARCTKETFRSLARARITRTVAVYTREAAVGNKVLPYFLSACTRVGTYIPFRMAEGQKALSPHGPPARRKSRNRRDSNSTRNFARTISSARLA